LLHRQILRLGALQYFVHVSCHPLVEVGDILAVVHEATGRRELYFWSFIVALLMFALGS
jgi:hypothetical protein